MEDSKVSAVLAKNYLCKNRNRRMKKEETLKQMMQTKWYWKIQYAM